MHGFLDPILLAMQSPSEGSYPVFFELSGDGVSLSRILISEAALVASSVCRLQCEKWALFQGFGSR
jgi:hypothetical protein